MASGVTPALLAAARQTMNGFRVNPDAFHVYDQEYYSIVDISTGGTQVQFFQTAPAQFSGKYSAPGQLIANEEVFLAWGTTAELILTGTAGQVAAATAAPMVNVQYRYDILSDSRLYLQLGSRTFWDDDPLYRFPAGGGLFAPSGVTNTNTTTINQITSPSNGIPHRDNIRAMRPAYPVLPQMRIVCQVRRQTAINAPSNVTARLRIGITGISITPANR